MVSALKKAFTKSMAYYFFISVITFIIYIIGKNFDYEIIWFFFGIIGMFTASYFLSKFIDWLFKEGK